MQNVFPETATQKILLKAAPVTDDKNIFLEGREKKKLMAARLPGVIFYFGMRRTRLIFSWLHAVHVKIFHDAASGGFSILNFSNTPVLKNRDAAAGHIFIFGSGQVPTSGHQQAHRRPEICPVSLCVVHVADALRGSVAA